MTVDTKSAVTRYHEMLVSADTLLLQGSIGRLLLAALGKSDAVYGVQAACLTPFI